MEDLLEKKQHVNLLLDCYEEMLTDKQRIYIDYYYKDDYTLSEIAEIMNVSRNAVFDNLKKSVKSLEKYENKLHLLEKHIQRMKLIDEIEEHQNIDHSEMEKFLEMLREI